MDALRISVPSTFREVEELSDVLTRVFNASGRGEWWERWVASVGQENLVHVRRGDRVVGGFGVFRAGLWFGGKAVPAGAVAAVGVRPEERGLGVGKALMEWHLQDHHTKGLALSVLYPATIPFYRRFGYELAGTRTLHRLPANGLDLGERTLAARPYEHSGVRPPAFLQALYERAAEQSAGALARSDGLWKRILEANTTHAHTIVVGPAEAPEGYVVWHHEPTQRVSVHDAVALTPRALARIFTLLHDLGTLEDTVLWPGPPVDLRLSRLPAKQNREAVHDHKTWMLRIVRVAEALRGRGYTPGLQGRALAFEIEDPLLKDNSGSWTLSFKEGRRAEITRGGSGGLRLRIEALAPLYSGLWRATELASAGHLEGDAESLLLADHAFGGPQPWMPDQF